ncbi:MAG: hypothetical protein AB7F59_15135 [Bdellovibrionales bacterium]
MGATAPGFSSLGMSLHQKADEMVGRLKLKDITGSIKALGTTLQTCTACHTTYQHKIVSAEEFRKLTKLSSAH